MENTQSLTPLSPENLDAVQGLQLKRHLKAHLKELKALNIPPIAGDSPRIAKLGRQGPRFYVSYFPESLSPGVDLIEPKSINSAKRIFRELAKLWIRGE